jgi:RNA polymerase sigma-70 factor (ECF subfamily)
VAGEERAVPDTKEFEELRPLLFSIAYRILGSVGEAEDAVQETWLRYARSEQEPESLRAWLSTVVTRIAIDELRSARARRETYVGPWFPEPLVTEPLDPYADPERSAELADSASMAALLLLERLSPLERAVFVLRDVFKFDVGEVAEVVERSEDAVRQLASRARKHMEEGRPRYEADRRKRQHLADRFFQALRDGDVDGLQELLAADVLAVNDSGGKAGGAGGLFGSLRAARLLVGTLTPLLEVGAQTEQRLVNGQPGAILRDPEGRVLATWALDILDGQIQAIFSVTNPDKLAHLGPVGDVMETLRRRIARR